MSYLVGNCKSTHASPSILNNSLLQRQFASIVKEFKAGIFFPLKSHLQKKVSFSGTLGVVIFSMVCKDDVVPLYG